MSTQGLGQSASGKKKQLLFIQESASPALVERIDELGAALGAAVRTCSNFDELTSILANSSEGIRLLVVDCQVTDFLGLARFAVSSAPLVEVVLLADASEVERISRLVGPAPRLGDHWSIQPHDSASLEKFLRTAFLRANQRKATRTTLDRFNARLAVPPSTIDASEMRALMISDRFLASVLDSAFDAVILIDSIGRITTFNRAAEALFERASDRTVSTDIHNLSSGSWGDAVNTAIRLADTGKTFHTEIEVGGIVRQVEVSAAAVFDAKKVKIATSLVVRDITARLQSENTIRTTEKLAVVGRLASSIAHEINNPLEAVTNLLYIARQHTTDPELKAWLDLADQELRRVSIITNQTLRFHKQSTAASNVDMNELLRGVLAIFHGKLLNSHIEVLTELRATKPVLCLDGEIRQVLTNLIGNAIDAMALGGRLQIRTSENQSAIVVTVSDSGTGMNALTQAKLFEAFYSTKGDNGTGLGLWISKEIVERHRGSLEMRSSQQTSHHGTTFRLSLPLQG